MKKIFWEQNEVPEIVGSVNLFGVNVARYNQCYRRYIRSYNMCGALHLPLVQ